MCDYYLTAESLEEKKLELLDLKDNKRREIAEKLREAKEFGDLSENAEYQEAKESQLILEDKIIKLENLVKEAKIIQKTNGHNKVSIGSVIKVKSFNGTQTTKIFSLVGSLEAKPEEGRISNESPLGKAFLEKAKGDIIVAKTPAGEVKYRIEEIS